MRVCVFQDRLCAGGKVPRVVLLEAASLSSFMTFAHGRQAILKERYVQLFFLHPLVAAVSKNLE